MALLIRKMPMKLKGNQSVDEPDLAEDQLALWKIYLDLSLNSQPLIFFSFKT